MKEKSLQEQYAPESICFGCGVKNAHGLHIRSFPQDDEVIAVWHPSAHHAAFNNVLNGGIIGALLDCHSNWTAAWYLWQQNKDAQFPCTVTAEYSIKLLRPTPLEELKLTAKVVEATATSATVKAKLLVKDKVCATCHGIFVAVGEGHPAYHRW